MGFLKKIVQKIDDAADDRIAEILNLNAREVQATEMKAAREAAAAADAADKMRRGQG
jgi:vacuolar-type H+-ATPase subunit E/Vma4